MEPMVSAFQKYIALPPIDKVEYEFFSPLGYGVRLHGFIDAICTDGTPVEHKTTSTSIDEKYIYRLNFDEQVTTYLAVLGKTKMIYTAVQKPTIRLKQNETEEEYVQRCYEWYDSENKARSFSVVRSADEINSWLDELKVLAREIKACKNFYRNPNACSILGCEYEAQCLDYSLRVE